MFDLEKADSINELPLVLSIKDLEQILHIGHCTAYKLVNSGAIRSLRVGSTIRIPRDALVEFLNQKP